MTSVRATPAGNTVVILPTPLAGAPSTSFRSLDSNATPFFDDDYVHTKLLNLKYKGVAGNFLVNAKGNLNLVQKTSKVVERATAEGTEIIKETITERPVTGGEVKLITRLSDKVVLESRFDNKGTVRLWSALGQYDLSINRPVSLWAKLKTTSDFTRWSGFLQAGISGEGFTYNSRLDRKANGELFVNEKLYARHQDFHFSAVTKISLANFNLRNYNALLAYRRREFDIVAQHISDKDSKTVQLGELSLAGYYRQGKHQGGLKVAFRNTEVDPARRITGVLGGIFKVDDRTTLKAKIDNDANLALALKYRHSANLLATLGTTIALTNPGSYVSTRTVPVPVGLQLEFSY